MLDRAGAAAATSLKVGYVCTNYNGTSDTLVALDSLLADGGDHVCAVVVDNCSRQDERIRLSAALAHERRVHLLLSETNLGYFSGLNAGISRLREIWPDCSIMVVGNNDLVFPLGFCAAVQASAPKLEQYPVLSPRIQTRDGREQNPHVVHSVSFLRECLYDLYHSTYLAAVVLRMLSRAAGSRVERGDEAGYARAQFIWQGHGSCFIIGPKFLREFGGFWAPTFLFGEEFFLSRQLQDKGYQVLYDPSIRLIHACHASVGSLPGRRHWQYSRAAHQLYRRYYPLREVLRRRRELKL